MEGKSKTYSRKRNIPTIICLAGQLFIWMGNYLFVGNYLFGWEIICLCGKEIENANQFSNCDHLLIK